VNTRGQTPFIHPGPRFAAALLPWPPPCSRRAHRTSSRRARFSGSCATASPAFRA